MKIGIDARVLGTSRALDYYSRNIIDYLVKLDKVNQYLLLVSGRKQLHLLKNTEIDYQIIPKKIVLRDHLTFKSYISKFNLDLIFHPDNTEFLHCLERSVVTLHDVISWRYPSLVLSKNFLRNIRQRFYFQMQKTALKKASHILTVSENSKKEINNLLGIPEEKISVTYESVDERFSQKKDKKLKEKVLKKYQIEGDYIFYIGGLEKHKNVEILIKAFAQSGRKEKLVIGGKTEQIFGAQSSYPELISLIKEYNLYDSVIFTGFIEDQDLPVIYSSARVFVYPSKYEGFGLPPLEALSAGVPVVASKIPVIKEVLGDSAFFFDPENVSDLSNVLKKALSMGMSERDALIRKGMSQAKKFDWVKTASKTIEIFNSLS